MEIVKSTLPCENCGLTPNVPRWGVLLKKAVVKTDYNLSADKGQKYNYVGTEEIFLCASCIMTAQVRLTDATLDDARKNIKVNVVKEKTPEWKSDKNIQMEKKETFQP